LLFTQKHKRAGFLCILPLSLYVVLWDGSAGCFLRLTLLFIVSRVRPVAELIASHTQVLALFSQLLFGALINVLVDSIVITFILTIITIFIFFITLLCFSPLKPTNDGAAGTANL